MRAQNTPVILWVLQTTCNTDLRGSREVIFSSDRQVWFLLHLRLLSSSYLTISCSLKLHTSCILDCDIFEKNLGTTRAECPGPVAIMQKFNSVFLQQLILWIPCFHQESFTCRSWHFGIADFYSCSEIADSTADFSIKPGGRLQSCHCFRDLGAAQSRGVRQKVYLFQKKVTSFLTCYNSR